MNFPHVLAELVTTPDVRQTGMMGRAKTSVLILGLLVNSPAGFGTEPQSIYVQDGDTIDLNGKAIRLEGIDAPELSQRCLNPIGQTFRCGYVARIELIRIIGGGVVNCEPSGLDLYGRTLAHCKVGGIEINDEMVSRGFARAFTKYSEEYLWSQSEAIRDHKGLWRGQWEAPWDWRKEHRK